MTSIDLPPSLEAWVESVTRRRVVRARRHLAGASREAWSIDVDTELHVDLGGKTDTEGAAPDTESEPPNRLFLLRDQGKGGGSERDAAVLRALTGSAVPVPQVAGSDTSNGLLLLERIDGRSDFPAVDQESEREPTARHLMALTGELHSIEPESLEIPHLAIPDCPSDSAREALARARDAAAMLGAEIEPFFLFALGWLERNLPEGGERCSLVHSDMGPGNFLFSGGRVNAIVDWEVAHFGDPMEDLAAIAVRDMATPIGHLPTRFAEYQASSGIPINLERVGYYRALVLVRNSLMIGLGLAHPPEGFDVVEMTMYQTLLIRAAALAICDCEGVDRPEINGVDAKSERIANPVRNSLTAAAQRDLEQIVAPELPPGLAAHRAEGIARVIASLAHEDRVGPTLDRDELADLESVLGESLSDLTIANHRLSLAIATPAEPPEERGAKWARYFARRFLRLGERRRPLMGPLMERLPQPLEDV